MGKTPVRHGRSVAELAVASAILDALDQPALIVHDSGKIFAANTRWRLLFAVIDDSPALPTVSEWLAPIDGGDALLRVLRQTEAIDEPVVLHIADRQDDRAKQYAARATRLHTRDRKSAETLILLTDKLDHPSNPDEKRQETEKMHRLLIRQTLIEERERRRLGREVHDHVTQLLVQVRRQLADARDGSAPWHPAETIADVDRVIKTLQELTSNFSPPVLEDLGLLPAMHWLAESLGARYGATAKCEDDGVEPSLSQEERTVAFRAIRELAVNAAKHAPGSQIVLSSSVENDKCRFMVRDDGPGFDRDEIPGRPDPYAGYGLLSVEQQIRAMGGAFQIKSGVGKGTHATITLRPAVTQSRTGETQHA